MTGRDTYGQLWNQFHQSTNVDEVIEGLERLDDLLRSEEIELVQAYQLRSRAFRTLQQLTVDDPEQAQAMIERHLLPFCLRTAAEEPSKIRIEIGLYRERLAEWLDQYPETERTPIRNRVLDEARKHLMGADAEGACWTISLIGHRRKDIVEALWELVEKEEGEPGDVALSVLTNLGVASNLVEPLLTALHERIAAQPNFPLIMALRRLAHPSSIDPVIQYLLQPHCVQEQRGFASLSLRILADVADANDDVPSLQSRVWRNLSRQFTEYEDAFSPDLHLGSDLAPRCNSEEVVSYLVSRMGRETGQPERDAHLRWLLHLRIQECIRPRQLMGWHAPLDGKAASVLRRDALLDTEQPGIDVTSGTERKEMAWKTLLCLGQEDILGSYEDAVAIETSPHLRRTLSKLLACFRLDPLPQTVLRHVTEPFNADPERDSQEWAWRLSATDLAQSAATWQAFEALLDFGLTVGGKVLQKSADALTVVAVALARAGETRAVEKLVEIVTSGREPRHRLAAASALRIVARAELLPSEYGL